MSMQTKRSGVRIGMRCIAIPVPKANTSRNLAWILSQRQDQCEENRRGIDIGYGLAAGPASANLYQCPLSWSRRWRWPCRGTRCTPSACRSAAIPKDSKIDVTAQTPAGAGHFYRTVRICVELRGQSHTAAFRVGRRDGRDGDRG
jgi:hypothetical protein